MPDYDILIYRDVSDINDDGTVSLGESAAKFGLPDMQVVAVGPPIHGGKNATVVLAHRDGPMAEIQNLLDRV